MTNLRLKLNIVRPLFFVVGLISSSAYANDRIGHVKADAVQRLNTVNVQASNQGQPIGNPVNEPVAAKGYDLAEGSFFDDIVIDDTSLSENPKDWQFSASLSEKIAYGLNQPGALFSRTDSGTNKVETIALAKLDWQLSASTATRLSMRASADAIYSIRDKKHFDQREIDDLQHRFELRDAYVETQLSDALYLKLGQQIIPWGQAENLRIIDLVNTQDFFSFGQQDLEDLRIPVPAFKLSYLHSGWLVDAVITAHAGIDDLAPAFDEFDRFVRLRQTGVQLDTRRASNRMEYLLRLSSHYQHGDIAFVIGEVNSNSLVAKAITFKDQTVTNIQLGQDRIQVVGASANWTKNNWLLFTELGLHFGKRLQPNAEKLFQYEDGWLKKNQSLAAIGAQYVGFNNWQLSAEFDAIHTQNYKQNLSVRQNQIGFSGRVLWKGFNDSVQVVANLRELLDKAGQIFRLSVKYDWSDSVEVELLWVDYSAKRGQELFDFRNNDVVQFQLRYHF